MAGPGLGEYYQRLGLKPGADAAAIKSAYRKLAFKYHPDRNPSAEAEDAFKRVTEAYEILTGARKPPKQARPKPKPKPQPKPAPKPEAKPRPKPSPKPTPKPEPKPQARPQASAPGGGLSGFASCVITGKVSAQPRFVEFQVVRGVLSKVETRKVGGVMSPDGAKKAALRASLTTWAVGFWSWKSWKRAFKAILHNMSGGNLPKGPNAELLLRQARAFEVKGQKETARAIGLAATAFAETSNIKTQIDALMRRLDTGTPPRRLKSEWRGGIGLNAFLQISPAMVPIFLILLLLSPAEGTISGAVGTQINRAVDGISSLLEPAAEEADVPQATHHVSAEAEILNLRSGPGLAFPVVSYLDRFTDLQVMGPQEGIWVPVRTAGGQIGYVSAQFVADGPGITAEKAWCETNVCN